jgi:CRP/FNR family transcriptional regulator, cyclic AMP receptor protein
MAVARILEEDPDLAQRLKGDDLARATAVARAHIDALPVGVWDEPVSETHHDGYGLLVLEGMIARRVTLGSFECTELLGQGDLLRPWTFDGEAAASVPSAVTWNVVEPVRLAVLDRRFSLATAPWPELTAELMERIITRTRWLAFQLAVCHVVRVDLRLLTMFWHFADRWGRVTREGVSLHMPVTHSILAGIVGARRPSVTTALGRLQEQGAVERLGGGNWLLRGEPPTDVVALTASTEMSA